MPVFHIRFILVAVVLCVYCCARTTYRDQILLHSMRQVQALALAEPDGQLLFEGAMQGMLDKLGEELGDDYSTYISPSRTKEFREMLDVKLEGIGVRFDPTSPEGTYRVLYPIINSPAIAAGIRCGDTILKVDGEDIKGLNVVDISKKIRGPEGTSVLLSVQHPGESKPVDISIKRKSIQQNTVYGFELANDFEPILNVPGNLSDSFSNSKIGYLYISSFNSHTVQEVLEYLTDNASKIEKLIIDVRGNPGGFLDAAVGVADLFVDNRGPYREIVTTKLRNHQVKAGGRHPATRDVLFHGPMVVLTDSGSASASEILAACLQDFDRATIIGERTYGKGTVQEIFDLPFNLGAIKLTDASYWRPSGKNINRVRKVPRHDNGKDSVKLSEDTDDWGVTPDIEVKISRHQKVLTYFLRELRIAVPKGQVMSMLKQYAETLLKDSEDLLKKLDEEDEEDIESEESEENVDDTETKLKFTPEGKAPFYDPILDKAIEFLNENKPVKKFQPPKEL